MLRIDNYRVGKYMRLSRDDGDDRESESIENQRDILDNYINEHKELEAVGEYIDDGYTGTNFNRPGFKQMMKDIEEGKINCIITKDLSRFGRDHIDTGYYLERYLPLKSIRYIAIGDNVDTLNPEGLQFLTFKLSFNDYYAQDISNKIKSVKNRKIEKGEFQGNTAPYGYKKDPIYKNHLIPDLEVITIVQEIYDLYVNKGVSTIKIADLLNSRNVEAPCIHLKMPNCVKNKDKKLSEYKWSKGQITKILRNEVYIGSMVGGKTRKVSHKVDKVRLAKKEERIVVKNMHEPIIDKKLWNKAQEKMDKYTKVKTGINEHPLKEFLYCAECRGKAIYRVRRDIRKSGKIWEHKSFICSNKNSGIKRCSCKPIEESVLTKKVRETIIKELKNIEYTEKELFDIYEKAEEKVHIKTNILKKSINKLKAKLDSNEQKIEEVYNDKMEKIITVEDFNIFYKKLQKEKEELLNEIHKKEEEMREIESGNIQTDYKEVKRLANEILKAENPTKEQYAKLIEKIEFDSKQDIILTLTFAKIEVKDTLREAV